MPGRNGTDAGGDRATRRRLTELARQAVGERLHPGDTAVDATAGNGHDTLFLARQVGEGGRVLAFDIQGEALAATRARLEAAGVARRVTLLETSHHRLGAFVGHLPHPPRAVMFNLGYLPGGDRSRITNPASTLPALESALACLAAGGVLSVIAYPGHPGGHQETEAVEAWFRRHPGFRRIGPHGDPARSPRLFLLRRP